jgi:hypothetical protein
MDRTVTQNINTYNTAIPYTLGTETVPLLGTSLQANYLRGSRDIKHIPVPLPKSHRRGDFGNNTGICLISHAAWGAGGSSAAHKEPTYAPLQRQIVTHAKLVLRVAPTSPPLPLASPGISSQQPIQPAIADQVDPTNSNQAKQFNALLQHRGCTILKFTLPLLRHLCLYHICVITYTKLHLEFPS